MERFLGDVERRAFRFARIATDNDDDALDLVQEAMMTLAQRYANRSEGEWPPLFHRILQNRIRDWYRRKTVRDKWRHGFGRGTDGADDESALQGVQSSEPALDEAAARRHAGKALERALHDLPLRQQQAFLLRAWEELDVAETARAMGCSEGSVKTHYARAVQTLRRVLGEHWP